MSLVASYAEQRRRIRRAKSVVRAANQLDSVMTDEYADDDLYVARTRLDNWLTEQPEYVKSDLRKHFGPEARV